MAAYKRPTSRTCTFSKIITAKEIEGRNKGNEPAAKKAKK